MIFDYESECSTDQHRSWLSIFRALIEFRSPSPKMTLLYLSEALYQLARTPDYLTAQFDHSAWLHRLFDRVLRG